MKRFMSELFIVIFIVTFISCPNFRLRLPVQLPANHVISLIACTEKKYLKFKDIFISGHNSMTLEHTDPCSCMAKCEENSCASMEYQLPVCTELMLSVKPKQLSQESNRYHYI